MYVAAYTTAIMLQVQLSSAVALLLYIYVQVATCITAAIYSYCVTIYRFAPSLLIHSSQNGYRN